MLIIFRYSGCYSKLSITLHLQRLNIIITNDLFSTINITVLKSDSNDISTFDDVKSCTNFIMNDVTSTPLTLETTSTLIMRVWFPVKPFRRMQSPDLPKNVILGSVV